MSEILTDEQLASIKKLTFGETLQLIQIRNRLIASIKEKEETIARVSAKGVTVAEGQAYFKLCEKLAELRHIRDG